MKPPTTALREALCQPPVSVYQTGRPPVQSLTTQIETFRGEERVFGRRRLRRRETQRHLQALPRSPVHRREEGPQHGRQQPRYSAAGISPPAFSEVDEFITANISRVSRDTTLPASADTWWISL